MADPGTSAPDPPPWKGTATPRAGGAWRADPKAAGSSRGKLIGITLFLIVAVAGAGIGILSWLTPGVDPAVVTLPLGELKNPAWPGVPWAVQDSDRLVAAVGGRGDKGLVRKAFAAQDETQFPELLRWLAGEGEPKTDPKQPLVVHVTALGVAHGGHVFILRADATPLDRTAWVPVTELLDAMEKSPAKQKLLILDLAHPAADPFNGVLRDDVADQLDALLTTTLRPFPVLTSCSPRELSLPGESCSGFMRFLAEGLRGEADGDGKEQKPDGTVTVAELGRYTIDRVAKWAKTVHQRAQTPKLYGLSPAADFGLTYRHNRPQSEQSVEQAQRYPDWLRDGWQLRAKERDAGGDCGVPAAFARLTAGLVRAERRWAGGDDRAGKAWDEAREEWDKAVRSSDGRTPAADTYSGVSAPRTAHRLAAAARRERPPKEWNRLLDNYLEAKINPPAKPDPADDPKKAWQGAIKDRHLAAAWVVWERASSNPEPTRKQMSAWAEVVKELELSQDYAELVLLAAIAGRDFRTAQGITEYPGAAVGELLRTEYELGLGLAAGPEGFFLIHGAIKEAELPRNEGQRKLFTARGKSEADAAAAELRTAAARLRLAKDVIGRWQVCNRALEHAAAALHDTLPAALAFNQPPFADWLKAADAATAVAKLVSLGHTAGSFDTAAAGERLTVLLEAVKPLARPPDEAVKRLLGAPRATQTDTAALQALLARTDVPADQRKLVIEALRADREAREAAVGDEPAAAPRNPDQADIAYQRAQASVGLLRLAGYEKADMLGPLLTKMDGDRRSPEPARALGEYLARAWLEELRSQSETGMKAGRWHDVERIARALPPGAAHPAGVPAADGGVAARKRAAAETAAYREAAAAQFRADAETRAFDTKAEAYYRKVAAD